MAAAHAGCTTVRRAALLAFGTHARAMGTSDIMACVGPAFAELYEVADGHDA